MGWCPPAGSMMASRRIPRVAGPRLIKPSSSGPRCRMASHIRSTDSCRCSSELSELIRPAMPHMLGRERFARSLPAEVTYHKGDSVGHLGYGRGVGYKGNAPTLSNGYHEGDFNRRRAVSGSRRKLNGLSRLLAESDRRKHWGRSDHAPFWPSGAMAPIGPVHGVLSVFSAR